MNSCIISPREQEVLELIAFEHSTKEIAQELYISEHTVITHRKNLLNKMDVKNAPGLVRKAFEIGIMQLKIVASLLLITFSSFTAYSQSADDDGEFLFAVVEFTQQANGNIEAEVLGHRVVEGRVKKPTESKISKSISKKDIVIEIQGVNGVMTDRVVMENPLNVPIRMAGGDGTCQTIHTQMEKFPIMIRRPLSKDAQKMTIRMNDNRKSAPITQLNFR